MIDCMQKNLSRFPATFNVTLTCFKTWLIFSTKDCLGVLHLKGQWLSSQLLVRQKHSSDCFEFRATHTQYIRANSRMIQTLRSLMGYLDLQIYLPWKYLHHHLPHQMLSKLFCVPKSQTQGFIYFHPGLQKIL